MKQPQVPLFVVCDPDGEPMLWTIAETEKESTQILCEKMYNNEVFSANWDYWKSKGATVCEVEIKITEIKITA